MQIHNWQLKSWIGPLLCEVGVAELTEKGVLASANVRFLPVEPMSAVISINNKL